MKALRVLALAILAMPLPASACATCVLDPGSNLAVASNSVLWMLLALVGFIFVATGLTAFYLWRRANAPIPPHIQLVENLNAEPEEI